MSAAVLKVRWFVLGVLVSVAVGALGAAIFVGSGLYDIGADDHHVKLVFA